MKYAILGDIHANLEALEAVLEALQKEKIDRYISVGDIVGYGASPSECISIVKKLNCIVVAGNHDYAVADKLNAEFFNLYARDAVKWTRAILSKEEKEFLGSLELVEHVESFTIVHSTLYAPELFEYIQTSYDAHLSFSNMNTDLCFIGHSHIPATFVQKRSIGFSLSSDINLDHGARFIVNVGSIGQPRDENPDAAYAVYDSDEKHVVIRRIKYDIDKAVTKILKAKLPPILGERLRIGR